MGQQAESTMLRPGSRSLLGTLSLALLVVTLAQPPREPSQSAQHNTVGGDLEEIMEGEQKLQHLLASPSQHTPACRQCFKGALGHLPQSSAATSTMDLSRLLSPQGPRGDAHLGKELKESWGTSRGVSVEDLLTALKKTRAEVASLQQQLKKANRALSHTKQRAKKGQDELLSLKNQLQDAKAALNQSQQLGLRPGMTTGTSPRGEKPGFSTGLQPEGKKSAFGDKKAKSQTSIDRLHELGMSVHDDGAAAAAASHLFENAPGWLAGVKRQAFIQGYHAAVEAQKRKMKTPEKPGSTGPLPDGKKSAFRDWPSYRKCTAQDARRSKYSGEWCGFMRNTKLLKTYPELNFCPKNTTDRSVYK